MTYDEAIQELDALHARLTAGEVAPDDLQRVLADARRIAAEVRSAMRGEP